MAEPSHKHTSASTTPDLLTLPIEVLSHIILYLIISEDDTKNHYPIPRPSQGWSFYLHEARSRRCLRATGKPICPVLLSCRKLHEVTMQLLKTSFTGCLVFTTAATPWRTFTKLRALTIQVRSVGWYLNNIRTLVFRAPPLFTSRIPWAELPGIRLVILDYSSRRSESNLAHSADGVSRRGMRLGRHTSDGNGSNHNQPFDWTRVSQALRSTGELDEILVKLAKDTERFDMPVIDDARRVTADSKSFVLLNDLNKVNQFDDQEISNVGIEVRIVKVLKFLYTKNQEDANDDESLIGSCLIRVVASYVAEERQIKMTILGSNRGKGYDNITMAKPPGSAGQSNKYFEESYLIWTLQDGFIRREKLNNGT